jgi:nephrocystin-3
MTNNTENSKKEQNNPQLKRSIRVFISSTFLDMAEERDALMTHCWPELRRFCRERHVEMVEVDLRWGISEEQSTRKETLKLCLDEIRACRPFFIGLLGERYGWVPGEEAFTADLKEEQPWIKELHGKSVTELEILHGVLNNPEMAGRSFFFFRDAAYAIGKGVDYASESMVDHEKQKSLKEKIRKTSKEKDIPLYENYPDPDKLARLVLNQLKSAIDVLYPVEDIPDPIDREANEHEAFAEIRRKTYIGRPEYFQVLDGYISNPGQPLLLLGDSGSGKSALLANWVKHWREISPGDYLFQHYIGGTTDSADHWKLMKRLISEIKRLTNDPDDLPRTNDDLLRDFIVWLAKARIYAEQKNIRFIIILDALNQLDDHDRARLMYWLPAEAFTENLKLIVSTLPGDAFESIKKYNWPQLEVKPLLPEERKEMIVSYLKRFGKELNETRLRRLTATPATSNPLYLKILLDELRVTGTHDRLDERLNDYLESKDIPDLLKKVLTRYEKDYEHDRPGLVGDALGLIWAARRGLTEAELLNILRPEYLSQLPMNTWTPLRAALEESLLERSGVLNFAHDYLRKTVEDKYVQSLDKCDDLRLWLAGEFENQPATERSCDELPWLLFQTESFERLRNCLLSIDNFLLIRDRSEDELRNFWVSLGDETIIGLSYLNSFNVWSNSKKLDYIQISFAANQLAHFLFNQLSIYSEAKQLYELAIKIYENNFNDTHPIVAVIMNNLAQVLQATDKLKEAEPLYKRAIRIYEKNYGLDNPKIAGVLSNLASLLQANNRLKEAEALYERAIKISEKSFGINHPIVVTILNNLATVLQATNRLKEAESLMEQALMIDEKSYGKYHPTVARDLNNLAVLLQETNRLKEAEPLMERALNIYEKSLGENNPNVAAMLNNLSLLLQATNRVKEAELLLERAIKIDEKNYGKDHPMVAIRLSNLGGLLYATNRFPEAEPLMIRALTVFKKSFGENHPNFATVLNNIAQMLLAANQLKQAEPLIEQALTIFEKSFGENHPRVAAMLNSQARLLQATNRSKEAEPVVKRALQIDERSFGKSHPTVAMDLNNLAQLLQDANRLQEAETLSRRAVDILIDFSNTTGYLHQYQQTITDNYEGLLEAMGWSREQIIDQLRKMGLDV